MVWFAIFLLNPGSVDGYLFPVTSRMQIERIEKVDELHSDIWGNVAKRRPNCSYRYISWYLGNRGDVDVPATLNTGLPVLRIKGDFNFGPWRLDIPASEVMNNSYADIYHRCKYMGVESPWLTKTRFWN